MTTVLIALGSVLFGSGATLLVARYNARAELRHWLRGENLRAYSAFVSACFQFGREVQDRRIDHRTTDAALHLLHADYKEKEIMTSIIGPKSLRVLAGQCSDLLYEASRHMSDYENEDFEWQIEQAYEALGLLIGQVHDVLVTPPTTKWLGIRSKVRA